MDGLDSVVADLSAALAGQRRQLQNTVAAPPAAEVQAGLEFSPGTRVFDLVTGQEGTVIAGSKTHNLIPAAG